MRNTLLLKLMASLLKNNSSHIVQTKFEKQHIFISKTGFNKKKKNG